MIKQVKINLLALLWLASLSWGQAPPVPFDLTVRSTLPIQSTRNTVLADMNGDGRPDLILQTDTGLSVRLNDGTGNLQANALVYTFSPDEAAIRLNSFVVADFNRDGFPDLALVTQYGISLYTGDGKGNLSPGQRTSIQITVPPLNLVTADFNGDGIPDIAFGGLLSTGYVRVFLGTGTGDFQELKNAFTGTVPVPSVPVLQVADVNKDGKPDLILNDLLPRTIVILINDGTGRFKVTQAIQRGMFDRPQQVAFGYFDKEGTPGFVVEYLSPFPDQDKLELWKSDAQGQFTQRSTFKTAANLQSNLITADVDGDGNLDVIGSSGTGTTVFFGDGAGGFTRTATVADAKGTLLAAADLDGDGKSEIVVTNLQSVSVLGSTVRGARIALTRDPPNPFTYGQVEFITASVIRDTGLGALIFIGAPTGTITLFDGTQLIAVSTLSNGTARFSTRFVPGIHAFHAVYSGDALNSAATADLILTEAGAPAAIRGVVNSPFVASSNIQVLVTDALGDPVPGAGVIFTAPIYGPSGTFSGSNTALAITGPDGIATAPLFTQNNYPGPYSITAVVSGYPSVSIAIPVTR